MIRYCEICSIDTLHKYKKVETINGIQIKHFIPTLVLCTVVLSVFMICCLPMFCLCLDCQTDCEEYYKCLLCGNKIPLHIDINSLNVNKNVSAPKDIQNQSPPPYTSIYK